jgi:hypothetical protein
MSHSKHCDGHDHGHEHDHSHDSHDVNENVKLPSIDSNTQVLYDGYSVISKLIAV